MIYLKKLIYNYYYDVIDIMESIEKDIIELLLILKIKGINPQVAHQIVS